MYRRKDFQPCGCSHKTLPGVSSRCRASRQTSETRRSKRLDETYLPRERKKSRKKKSKERNRKPIDNTPRTWISPLPSSENTEGWLGGESSSQPSEVETQPADRTKLAGSERSLSRGASDDHAIRKPSIPCSLTCRQRSDQQIVSLGAWA